MCSTGRHPCAHAAIGCSRGARVAGRRLLEIAPARSGIVEIRASGVHAAQSSLFPTRRGRARRRLSQRCPLDCRRLAPCLPRSKVQPSLCWRPNLCEGTERRMMAKGAASAGRLRTTGARSTGRRRPIIRHATTCWRMTIQSSRGPRGDRHPRRPCRGQVWRRWVLGFLGDSHDCGGDGRPLWMEWPVGPWK